MNKYEQYCFDNATCFSAVRGASPFNRIRKDFGGIDEAKAFAAGFGDGKTMIYAITETGNNAHICNA